MLFFWASDAEGGALARRTESREAAEGMSDNDREAATKCTRSVAARLPKAGGQPPNQKKIYKKK